MNRRTYRFSGHVQGVGFRYTARHATTGNSVTGYVKNLPDGQVEMVMEGSDEEMDGVVETIRSQMNENIKRETYDVSPATGQFVGFEIRH
jgi:acylphosphatase